MRIKINQKDTVFTAYIKRRIAGHLIVDRYAKPLAVFKVAVNEGYRRAGVGTALYRAAEEAFGMLVPSNCTSDDAFAFWNKYRPGSMPNDLRHRRDELLGRAVCYLEWSGIINGVGSGVVIAGLVDEAGRDTGRTFAVRWDRLENALAAGRARGTIIPLPLPSVAFESCKLAA